MNFVCKHVYVSLAQQFPELSCLVQQFEDNVESWKQLEEAGPYQLVTAL